MRGLGDNLKICIEGPPIAKQRARHANHGKYVVTYDPQNLDKQNLRWQLTKKIREALDSEIKEISMEASNLSRGNVFEVDLWFYLPIRDKEPDAQKNAKLWGLQQAICKPDYDNLEKFYLDCGNGILWPDDRMIVDAHAHKRYGNPPRVEITIMVKEELKLTDKAMGILKVFSPTKLNELMLDIQAFGQIYSNDVEKLNIKDKEIWLKAVTSLLSVFTERHLESLNKIKKYLGLDVDLENLEKCKSIIKRE